MAIQGSLQATGITLPLDIAIEAIVATIILCMGLVLGAPTLRPIHWNVWAGKIESDGDAWLSRENGDKDRVAHPFWFLDTRPGFLDIRRDRRLFISWVKDANL